MRQTMAFYEQLQSAAFRDVAEAGGHDRQAFAQLTHLANADFADALNELQQEAYGDGAEEGHEELADRP